MPLLAKKATVTELYCACMSLMSRDRAPDNELKVVAHCTDPTCPFYGKLYELSEPFEDIVLADYVPTVVEEVKK